jgi:lipoprotein-anchoring transpeptidase ErfK/SrfK
VSLGKEGFLTRSGIKAVMEKYLEREMTSEALGITDPNDQYRVVSPYATRITNSGEFVHGAPWAAGRIGRWNGSHGCTNLMVADSKWFYEKTRVGDPVVTVNTGRSMEYWNGLGAPWNMPWSLWLQKSAAKGQKA